MNSVIEQCISEWRCFVESTGDSTPEAWYCHMSDFVHLYHVELSTSDVWMIARECGLKKSDLKQLVIVGELA